MFNLLVSAALVALGIGLGTVISRICAGTKIDDQSARLASALKQATTEFHHVELNYQRMTPRFICTIYDDGYPCYGKSSNATRAVELALQATQETRDGKLLSELAEA